MIVKMKKLSAVCSKDNYREVLKELYSLGCVELESASREILGQAGDLLYVGEVDTGSNAAKSVIAEAIKSLDRYAPEKVSMFAPRAPLSEEKLFDTSLMTQASENAKQVKLLSDKVDENNVSVLKFQNKIAALKPWEPLDVPLETTGTESTFFVKGVLPFEVDPLNLKNEIEKEFGECTLNIISSDKEQHYLTVLYYKDISEQLMERLKSNGFMASSLHEFSGTALENINEINGEISSLEAENEALIEKIKNSSAQRCSISAAYDAFTKESERDVVASSLGRTKKTVVLTGWVPEEREGDVKKLFERNGCAWEFSDPAEGEEVPVTYKTNAFAEPFIGITDMYGTPSYDSVVDPNPLMSIFYFTFFGFMMCDAMYGILIFLGSYLFLKIKRPAGSMRGMLKMFMYCGVSTFIAGVLTGGWFADSVSAISYWATGKTITIPPLWFDPLSAPMTMLAFSLVLGAIQLLTGMALSGYRMIKQGHPLDALFDIGSWWVLFAGIGMYALKISFGMYVAVFGALMLLLTGGRKNKGLGKITGGLGSLYNVTGYVSDLLSYSRIMALGLSGAVVGQVVNKIATMAHGITGIILFVCVFTFGHVFNIAVSLLGAYVHASRLQYIEFFGKFFDDGGRAFKPLVNNTKYVEIIKEEN